MRILVTGAAGFIGQHLCPALTHAGHHVTSIDRRDADLTQPGQAAYNISRAAPDTVIHLAAQVGRLFGEQDATHTITSNAIATTLVAQAASDAQAQLVYLSTSEIYGDAERAGLQADDDQLDGWPLPYNLYGLTKRWGEEAARLYAPHRLRIVRLAMPYGPGLPAGRGRAAIVNMLAEAHHRRPVTVHADAKRCWCWIADSVDGIVRIVEQDDSPHPEAYNVGRDDNEASMLSVAQIACDLTGADADTLIRMVPAPPGQVLVKRLPTEKLGRLGWKPTIDLEEGMALLYAEMIHAGHLS
jgi:nucleoside-diphosphate-sugar epimerase